MTTGTVRELTNQIENKTNEIHALRRDLRELYQDLKEEVERVENDEREANRGRSVTWEEIEWDIQCTESAISAISKQVRALTERLYKLVSNTSSRRVATE